MPSIYDDLLGDSSKKDKPARVKGTYRFGKRRGEVKIPLRKRVKFPDVGHMKRYEGSRRGVSLGREKKDFRRIVIWWVAALVALGLMLWWFSNSLGKENEKLNGERGNGISVEDIVAPETNVHGERYDMGVSTMRVEVPAIGELTMVEGSYSSKWYNKSVEISDYLANKYDLDWTFYHIIAEEPWGYWVMSDGESSRYAVKVNTSVTEDNLYAVLLGEDNVNLISSGYKTSNGVVVSGMYILVDGDIGMSKDVTAWGAQGIAQALDAGMGSLAVTVMPGLNGDGYPQMIADSIGEDQPTLSGQTLTVYEISSVGSKEDEVKLTEEWQKHGVTGKLATSKIMNSYEVVIP